ncbi:hypothetical protein NI471_16945 [Escherichia coli]|uniref:hypothetical protein n=1 Tax=Escherichia coli TaxID=562 RepID=UPI00209BA010|nr:hypothetical protein [Escherichia coli]MCO7959336.1 hypothetical protein [Escherichia coli]
MATYGGQFTLTNFLMRAIFSLLLLFTLSIPVISDCVAMAIESRFKYMMLLF